MSQSTKQVKVVALAAPVPGQDFEPTAFFDGDGNPVDLGGGGTAGPVAFDDLTGVPAALIAAQPKEVASIRAIGTTATTAAAGDHKHTAAAVTVTAATGIVGAHVQAVLADLAARVVALEAAGA